jgi:hypothetical protein
MGDAQRGIQNQAETMGAAPGHRRCQQWHQAAQLLLLALVSMLDGLGQPEKEVYDRQLARERERIVDLFLPIKA